MDEETSRDMYRAIDRAVYEQAPWIYLYYPMKFHAVSPHVEGYAMPTVYLGADYAHVTKKQKENSR